MYTLPLPSTATPVGNLSPEETRGVTVWEEAALTTAQADEVVVPNAYANAEGGLALPNATDPRRAMLVYDASQFAAFGGPMLITQLAVRPNSAQPGPGSLTDHNSRTFLSTTSQSPAMMSTNFADYIGPDYTLVSGVAKIAYTTANLPGPGNTRQFDVVVPFDTPFHYDPSAGNLLVEFQEGPPATEGTIIFDFAMGDPTVNLLLAVGSSTADSGNVAGLGFVMQFTVQAPP
jgi:hypothetical protein